MTLLEEAVYTNKQNEWHAPVHYYCAEDV